MKNKINLFWFRRDLRINDNAGLYHALISGIPVLPVFIFDKYILDKLNRDDARVTFIYQKIQQLKNEIEMQGGSLLVLYDAPYNAFKKLIADFDVQAVFTNKDYEPYSIERDSKIQNFLESIGIDFFSFKDHVIFEENEVVKNNGDPYTVFTPYCNKWKQKLGSYEIPYFPSEKAINRFLKTKPFFLPEPGNIGFKHSSVEVPLLTISEKIIANYNITREIPAIQGTSKLGVHLRFGTISIREVTKIAQKLSEIFLNELIWRNFYFDILWHFPHVENKAFKQAYEFILWRNNEKDFEKWSRGETGFPLVDAGMRELNATGFMHNRIRMVAASFLTKHLLIDWRWGEAYFAAKLLDYELASNNGNWQWAAGTGCDAAPYFRIFNPESQQKKFDPEFKYIMKWVPEYGTSEYPSPIVDHKFARERALKTYKQALK